MDNVCHEGWTNGLQYNPHLSLTLSLIGTLEAMALWIWNQMGARFGLIGERF